MPPHAEQYDSFTKAKLAAMASVGSILKRNPDGKGWIVQGGSGVSAKIQTPKTKSGYKKNSNKKKFISWAQKKKKKKKSWAQKKWENGELPPPKGMSIWRCG